MKFRSFSFFTGNFSNYFPTKIRRKTI